MPIKFNGNIKFWKGVGKKTGDTTIRIRFSKGSDTKEIYRFYKVVQSILNLKYGKGVK